jgi:hypothetical protein
VGGEVEALVLLMLVIALDNPFRRFYRLRG